MTTATILAMLAFAFCTWLGGWYAKALFDCVAKREFNTFRFFSSLTSWAVLAVICATVWYNLVL